MNSFNECIECGNTSSTEVALWDKCPRCSSTNTSGFKLKTDPRVQLLCDSNKSRIKIVSKNLE